MNNDVRHPLTEECRHRVTRRFVWMYLVIALVVAVVEIALWIRASDGPVDVGLVFVIGPLLYVWGMSTLVCLTFGWAGIYVSPSTTWVVIAGASVVAVMSGIIFYGVSVFTTPTAVLIGAVVHAVIVGIQRWLGIRLVPTAIASPVAAVS